MRRFEVKFERFLQIGESLFFGFTLAGNIHFQALRDIPLSLAPDGCGERSLHDHILSHAMGTHIQLPLPRKIVQTDTVPHIQRVMPAFLAASGWVF